MVCFVLVKDTTDMIKDKYEIGKAHSIGLYNISMFFLLYVYHYY